MRRDLLSGLSQQQRPFLANMFLPNNRVLQGLTALDLLRGWHDDFLGKSLHEQYTTMVNAGGAVALQDARHGGVVRLSVPNTVGAYARLFLGDGAGGYSTACIDYEWISIIRMKVNTLNVAEAVAGAFEVGTNNLYYGGYVPASSANWLIYSRDSGGSSSWTASTVAVDTDWHWLHFLSQPTLLKLYLDGSLICTHNTNLPTGCMEPFLQCYRDTGALNLDVDFWAWIPK